MRRASDRLATSGWSVSASLRRLSCDCALLGLRERRLPSRALCPANAATLDQAKTRGQLICGANRGLAGSGLPDDQGFMVRKKLSVDSPLKLDGASIRVQQGTTTELNLADYFRANNMKLEAVVFATDEGATKAYNSGRCGAYTTDASVLYSERFKMSNPDGQWPFAAK
jgi:hypothetical protein